MASAAVPTESSIPQLDAGAEGDILSNSTWAKEHKGQPKIESRGSTASFFLFLLLGQETVVAA